MLSKPLLLLAAAILAAAQTETKCNPTNATCPPDPAFGTSHNFNFNQSVSGDLFESYGGGVDFDPKTGAAFTINKQGDSPTMRTQFYFFFGQTEIIMKAAAGQGIVSSMMWLSDDLDEVDWEFLGTNTTDAMSNYFGKGNEDWHNGGTHTMPAPPQDDYHNYTCHWTKDKLEWSIDGNVVRTLTPDQANATKSYPQTPMRMSFGIWAGGDPNMPKGTREWAGGDTDYSKGPYTMYVKSVKVSDFSSGKEYKYGDRSGSWQSIDIVDADKNSTAKDNLNKPPPKPEETASQKWNNLSSGAKIAIYCSAGTVAALGIVAAAFYCIKQRRRGAQEAKLAAQRAEDERAEIEQFRKEGRNPDALRNEGVDYDARSMAGRNIDGNDSVADLHHMPPVAPSSSHGVSGGGGRGWDASDVAMASAIGGAAVGVGAAAGYSHVRSHSPPVTSPSSSTTFQGMQSPRSPPPGGLGAPSGGNVGYHPVDQGSIRSNTPASVATFHDNNPHARGSGYGPPMSGPGSPVQRTDSPGMPNPMRMSQVGAPMMRHQSPGLPPQGALPPTPSYPTRAVSGSPASLQSFGSNPPGPRMQSPGPRMQSPASRMASPGPGRMQSPGPPPNGYGNQGGYQGPHAY